MIDKQDKFFWARHMDDSTYETVNGIDVYYVMFDDNSDLTIFAKNGKITDTSVTDGSAKRFISLISNEDLDWLKSIARIRESKLKEALPTNVKDLAKKVGKEKDAEKLWKKAVKIAEEEKGKKEKDFSDSDVSYTMGVFKNMLGIKEKKLTKKDFMSLHKSNQILLIQGGLKMSADDIQKKVEGVSESDIKKWKGQPVSSVDVGSQSSSGLTTKVSSFEHQGKTFFVVESVIDNSNNTDVSWNTIDVYSILYIVKDEAMKEKVSYMKRQGSFRINDEDGEWEVIELGYGIEYMVRKVDGTHFIMKLADESGLGHAYHIREFQGSKPDFYAELLKWIQGIEMIGGKKFAEKTNEFLDSKKDAKEYIMKEEKDIIVEEKKSDSFLECNMDARTWLETDYPTEDDMEETMTSGSATSVGLPENPGKVKKADVEEEAKVEEKDDRDLIVDDRDPLDK